MQYVVVVHHRSLHLMEFHEFSKNNNNICVNVNNFTPFIYLELPPHIKWTLGKAQLLSNNIFFNSS